MYICVMNLFNDLIFNADEHLYILDGKPIPSTSKKISELHKEFPYEQASKNVAKKLNTHIQFVKNKWEFDKEVAQLKGNITHDHAENKSKFEGWYINAVDSFLYKIENSDNLEIVCKEIRMYTRKFWIAGTADLLVKNKVTGNYIIYDYKTNKDLFKTYNDFMYAPFDDLIAMPYTKYIIQLNTYKLMLEEVGLNVESMQILWLTKRNNHSAYSTYELPDITKKLKNHYANRRNNQQHIVNDKQVIKNGYGYYPS